MVKVEELNKKKKKELLSQLKLKYTLHLPIESIKKEKIALVHESTFDLILFNNSPLFIRLDKDILPTIFALRNHIVKVPTVQVDAGAVRHILNGADIFSQGVTAYDSFQTGEIVAILNPQATIIAVGKSLVDHSNIKPGKIIKNLHYAGDKIYMTYTKYRSH